MRLDTAPLLGGRTTTHLRLVVDACVLEVYVDGGLVTITQQVFPHAPLTELRLGPAPSTTAGVSAG